MQASLRLQQYEQVRRPPAHNSSELVRIEALTLVFPACFGDNDQALRDATLAVEAVRGVQPAAPVSAAWLTSLADGLHLQVRIRLRGRSARARVSGAWECKQSLHPRVLLCSSIQCTSPRQGVSALGSGDVRGACRALRAAIKLMPHDSDICKQFSHAVRPSCCGARGRPFTLSHANLPEEGGATQISRGGSNVGELPSVRNVLEGHPTGADLRVSITRPPGTLHYPGGEEARIRALAA